MPLYAIHDVSTGRILKLASSSAIRVGEGSIEVSSDMYQCDLTHYVEGSAMVPRPALTGWTATIAPADLDLSGLTAGSTFTVTNEAGDQLVLTDFGEPLQLTDRGAYTLTVEPPFPYLPLEQRLTLE